MTEQPTQIQIQAQWILDQMNVPAAVNQMLIQEGAPVADGAPSDGVYLTFGHLNPPVITNLTTEIEREALAATVFPVVPVSRFLLSRDRLKSFHVIIGQYLEASENNGQ